MDNELKILIKKDIDRTLQEKSLFQKEEVKEMMVNILFIWSKSHPEISYRQGMNELLAVMVIVAYAEKCYEVSIENEAAQALKELNDPNFTEADVYWMFSSLMDLGVKELFLPVLASKKKQASSLLSFDRNGFENELVNTDKTNEIDASMILKRCHRVHHRLLQALDKQLYTYMESQKIEPQIYLQRWIRCILSREFSLSNTLVLWDSIFAYAHVPMENKIESFTGKLDFSKEIVMLDFICIAMIIFVRSFCKVYLVLQCDATGIMRRLLKYPPVEDVHILISMAISYKERILNGKGVAVPQKVHEILEEDHFKNKNENKTNFALMTNNPKPETLNDRIDGIIGLLTQQTLE
jgi:TBC1 domain family member 5